MRARRARGAEGVRTRGPTIPRADGASKAINATPLIDVVMCLIVFYLMVGTLAGEKLAAVDLPEARIGQPDEKAQALVINIPLDDSDGAIVVEGRSVSERELEASVRMWLATPAEGSDAPGPIEVRAGRRVPFGRVAPALRACERAGARGVQLVAEDAR